MLLYLQRLYELFKSITAQTEDGSFKTVIVETPQEFVIERGLGFKIQVQNTALVSGATDKYLLRTPVDELITLGIESLISSDSSSSADTVSIFRLFEDATITVDGDDTNVTITNFNRNFEDVNGFLIKNAPTVTDNGVLLMTTFATPIASSNPNITFQLKANTDYVITIANPSTVTARYILTAKLFELPLS